jgi:transposase
MNKFSKYVGLDIHQETVAVAVADTAGEVRYLGEIVNTPEAIAKLVGRLKRRTQRLAFCYEVGPCGYTICRQLRDLK